MFKQKSLDKKGFGHVEMIVFAVVILAIGGIGWYTLKGSKANTNYSVDPGYIDDPAQGAKLTGYTATSSLEQDRTKYQTNDIVNGISNADAYEKGYRKKILAKATNQINVAKEVGVSQYIPEEIAKYMRYTKGSNDNPNNYYNCLVTQTKDFNRNSAFYPHNWNASFVSWVYNEATWKDNFKHGCTSNLLLKAALAKNAWFQIDNNHQPKPGDVIFTSRKDNIKVVNKASIFVMSTQLKNVEFVKDKGKLNEKRQKYDIKGFLTVEANVPPVTLTWVKNDTNGKILLKSSVANYAQQDAVRMTFRNADYWTSYIDVSKMVK